MIASSNRKHSKSFDSCKIICVGLHSFCKGKWKYPWKFKWKRKSLNVVEKWLNSTRVVPSYFGCASCLCFDRRICDKTHKTQVTKKVAMVGWSPSRTRNHRVWSLVEQRLLGAKLYYHCRTLHFLSLATWLEQAAMVIISPCICILSKFARIWNRSYFGSFIFVSSFKESENSRKHEIVIRKGELERNGEHGNYTMVSWTHVKARRQVQENLKNLWILWRFW